MSSDFQMRLRDRQVLIGTIVTLPCPQVAELLAITGFDWLFLDGEHAPLGLADMQGLLQAAGEQCPCVVRIPANRDVYIKQALDSGAAGVIAPNVNTAQEARLLVNQAKYPPQGSRSVGIARAHGYGMDFVGYMAVANHTTAVIVQVEHLTGAENIEAILDVEGIDAVFIGPYDLSASLGKTGNLSDPEVLQCIDHVRERCLERDTPVGIFTTDADAAKAYTEEGYSLIALGMDTVMLGRAAGKMLNRARG